VISLFDWNFIGRQKSSFDSFPFLEMATSSILIFLYFQEEPCLLPIEYAFHANELAICWIPFFIHKACQKTPGLKAQGFLASYRSKARWNPTKLSKLGHDLAMTKYQTGPHTKRRLQFHLVQIPKYRWRILRDNIVIRLRRLLYEAWRTNRWWTSELRNHEGPRAPYHPDLVHFPPRSFFTSSTGNHVSSAVTFKVFL
jgi:hypothetical protein